MKTYVLPPTTAALAAALVAVPALLSAPAVELNGISLAAAVNDVAPHTDSKIEFSAESALAPVVPTPTLLDVAGLPIQTVLAIIQGVNPPPNTDPQTYTSVYTVINNAISVARVPLSLVLTGQFSDIAAPTQAAWTTFITSLTQGLPQSVAATVEYAAEVIYTYLNNVVPPENTAADAPVAAAAAAPPYDLLDVLGLPIQTAFAIVAGGTAGVTLPTSPLIPSPYTSIYTVINNAISVLRVPLSLALTGQFSDIAVQTQAAFSTFATSLTQGLPDSIRGTLEWDLSVIDGFLSGTTDTEASTTDSAATLSAKATEVTAALETSTTEEAESTPADIVPVAEPAEVTEPGDFVKRLQSAVDKHLDVPAVDSRPAEDQQSHEGDEPDATADGATADDAANDAEGEKDSSDDADPGGAEPARPSIDDTGDAKAEKDTASTKDSASDNAE
ncbi:hypothetical protein BH10ACT9_BH10ACT9_26950 [soil metagenome]